MSMYFSALVQTLHFEEIHMNYLIVGHTHSSIDQYFSVLSRAIKKSLFIGSPLALHNLLYLAHKKRNKKDNFNPPVLVKQVSVYFDLRSAFLPYVNTSIKVCKFVKSFELWC